MWSIVLPIGTVLKHYENCLLNHQMKSLVARYLLQESVQKFHWYFQTSKSSAKEFNLRAVNAEQNENGAGVQRPSQAECSPIVHDSASRKTSR